MTKKNETSKEPQAKLVKITLSEKEKNNASFAKGRKTSYTVPENEQNAVHVELEKVEMDNVTFEKKSKPEVVIYDINAWMMAKRNLALLGFSHIRVLYAPKGVDTEVPTLKDLIGKQIKSK